MVCRKYKKCEQILSIQEFAVLLRLVLRNRGVAQLV